MALMTIRGLEKRYSGSNALNGVDLTIEPGKIVGLLGPNASGKTTLMKTVSGLLAPDGGAIEYPGSAARGIASKRTVSFLPDSLPFPGWMRVRDAFRYYEDMYPDYSPQRAAQMMDILELPTDTRIKRLSKGMQERVALGVTFSRSASLYLLDEPLGGIDPVGKMKVLDSILTTQLEDAAILLSTHLVKDVETIFDYVFFISEGRIVFQGNCEEMRRESGKTVEQAYLEVFSNVKAV